MAPNNNQYLILRSCAQKTILILLGLLYTSFLRAESVGLHDTWINNRAVDDMDQKKQIEAYEQLSDLAVRNPGNFLFLFNLSSAFIGVEQNKNALKMLQELEKATEPMDPILKFAIHYNLGVLFSDKKLMDVDQALHHYQQALAVNPESKEVKTNIELLFKSGQGQGKGENQDNQEGDQEQKEQDEGEQPKEPQEFTNKPQQPNQFNGEDMTKQDVNQVLDELKKQEQKIRAKYDRKGKREADRAKNW